MKGNIDLDKLLRVGIEFEGEIAKLQISLKGAVISGVLTEVESQQIAFWIERCSDQTIRIEGAEDLLGSLPLYSDAVQKQVTTIDALKKELELERKMLATAKDEIVGYESALKNQKDVIETLRSQIAESEKPKPVHNEPLPTNEVPGPIPAVEQVTQVI